MVKLKWVAVAVSPGLFRGLGVCPWGIEYHWKSNQFYRLGKLVLRFDITGIFFYIYIARVFLQHYAPVNMI